MITGRVALRSSLVVLIALALAASVWMGYQRSLWESSYKKIVIAVPYQELAQTVYDEGDRLWRERLEYLRALGVSILTLELSDFPDWNLKIVQIDSQLLRALAYAKTLGFEIGFVADIGEAELADRVQAFAEGLGIEPAWFMLLDLPPMVSPLPVRERVQGEGKIWAILEFAEPPMSYELKTENVVRAHAIKSKELDRLGLSGALDRWERAVQERNIRLLWLTEHERFTRYLERLQTRLSDLGFQSHVSLSFASLSLESVKSSLALYLLIALGLTALVLLLLQGLGLISAVGWLLFMGALLSWGWALLGLWDLVQARQVLALGIALVAPWALIILLRERMGGWKFLIMVSLGSIGAGLAIAALLSDAAHFLKLQEFRGVKLALITPALLVIATEFYRARAQFIHAGRGVWMATAIGAGALFFVLERSGNLPFIPVARWEELLRERLEDLFIARPRFKEFLIGHPVLVLFNRNGSSPLISLVLLSLGALGQASVINTFAHLHTPLWLSLWRTLNGLLLGLMIGFFLYVVLRIWQQWRRRSL